MNDKSAAGQMPETKFTLHAETLQGDLMKLVLDELKAAPNVWPKLSEDQQDDVILRTGARVKEAVVQAVSILAGRGQKSFKATVESVTFKDGVKATLSGSKFDEQRHLLADAAGRAVLVVIADASEFLDGGKNIKADADQAELELPE